MGFALLILIIVAGFFIYTSFGDASISRKWPSLSSLGHPYYKSKPLTDTEQLFYSRLLEALPEYVVLPQVQLSRFIKVKKQASQFEYNRWFYPIAQQSVDYLICERDFSILAAIELDDRSHTGFDSEKRDQKKTLNLGLAGIKLIRWHVESMPGADEIRASIVATAPEATSVLTSDVDHVFFTKPDKKNDANLIKIGLAIAGIFFIFVIFTSHKTSLQASSNQTRNASESNLWQRSQSIGESYKAQAERQRITAEQEAAEKRRIAEFQKQYEAQERIRRNQQKLEAIEAEKNERQAKEAAWERYYKKRAECESPASNIVLVECGNEYMRAKQKFEQQWELQKQQTAGM